MKNENTRTMKYLGEDNWNRPVYKCLENNTLWKDITLGSDKPELYTCQNEFEGEPEYPIKSDLEILFIGTPEKISEETKFNYMMLDRLRSDCEYYLGYGNRNKNRLHENDEKLHIERMKERYNNCPVKPEWLKYEKILEYEKLMCNNNQTEDIGGIIK